MTRTQPYIQEQRNPQPTTSPPNPRPQSNFPGIAFAPAPRRPPPSAFKRMLSRVLRKLKRYLDAKAAEYANEQQQAALPATRRTGRGMEKRDQRHARSRTAANRRAAIRVTRTPSSQPSPSRLSSGTPAPAPALPLLRPAASTKTSDSQLDTRGPFSASQRRTLSRKLTTIQESSAEGNKNPSIPMSSSRKPTISYSNDVDVPSDPQHNGPNTPLSERAGLSEHFPNLTCKHCNIDWARVDRLALQDLTLLRNTEAMRDVSREAAAQLRAGSGWVRQCEDFDDRIWHEEGSRRRTFITALVSAANAARRHRHRRTPSAQSVPSLTTSLSSLGSIVDSFPTPANVRHSLEADNSSDHRGKAKASPKTPVITVSRWGDERTEGDDAATMNSRGTPGIEVQPRVQLDGGQVHSNSLYPPKPLARLRGKHLWYLKKFSPPPRPASLPLLTTLPVPSQPVDFFMERPLEIPESLQPMIYA